jgi:anti-sigma factor RsiW
MNCQNLNSLLDMQAPEELSAAQKRDVESHFASCATCREAWAVYNELVAEPIPDAPRDLHRRIAMALEEAEPSDAGRLRRSIITGGALVVGAALAKTLTLGWAQSERMCPRT